MKIYASPNMIGALISALNNVGSDASTLLQTEIFDDAPTPPAESSHKCFSMMGIG